MESIDFDWLNGDYALNISTPVASTSGSPRASPAAERVDQPSGERALPLLRLSGWKSDKQYDKNNPICIHYDFQWKISQRENIRARNVCSDTDPDLVLAPSDFWKVKFQAQLESLMKEMKDEESLSDLFSKGRKIAFSMEFVYKEVTCDSTMAKGKKKKKSATEAQKLQRAADAGLWTRIYEHYRCRGKYCKQGPHCWSDERGNHHRLLPGQLEEIVRHIKDNMKEGETEEDVDIDIKIPSSILKNILDNSRKQKADGLTDCRHCKTRASAHSEGCNTRDVEGDRHAKLEEYCTWGLTQVESDRWRSALQIANKVAMDQFLELNTILQHPKVVAELMVKHGVKPGIALQFVSNVERFQREEQKS
ncbi:hypothetical protein VC83_03635 [Pseudogymnoascus destructans]|uniref:Uncharacterized protein n=2 Tax=Pseudogymnoascus destructans TaxID=655981 RepID=L8G104_PSED2|nr:uncharacterized protein VC83_03635 [Pseudogymnoascus destructans]ELR06464.1 hypothetical protein GMDG_07989 [Pseudogymnoascus destructans 20631-21]OAF60700.1 hypothetical protein VC83_03635 [Pseudogymnoascus destructans]